MLEGFASAIVVACWSVPLLALACALVGRRRSRRLGRVAPRRVIVQVTTTGEAPLGALWSAMAADWPWPLERWVVSERALDVPDGVRMVVVPSSFTPARARAKARALCWAQRLRADEQLAGEDVKVLFLDDDSVPTRDYVIAAAESGADVAQGRIVARAAAGVLGHVEDVRTVTCSTVCRAAQSAGRPVHVHGEGLCVRASTEARVGWDRDGDAAEDLAFGHAAERLGCSWAFVAPGAVVVSPPWTFDDLLRQRRRWAWGTVAAVRRCLAREQRLRLYGVHGLGLASQVVSFAALAADALGGVALPAGARVFGWLSLALWLGLFARAGWVSARAVASLPAAAPPPRIGWAAALARAVRAAAFAWPSTALATLAWLYGLALGRPAGFAVIAKDPPAPRVLARGRRRRRRAVAALTVVALAGLGTTAQSTAPTPAWTTTELAAELPSRGDVTSAMPVLPPRDGGWPRQGVTVLVYGNDPFFTYKARRLVARLRRAGATHVNIAIPIYTEGRRSSRVRRSRTRTPTDGRIRTLARLAHRRGMSTSLTPLLDERAIGAYRGSIAPRRPSRWFESYGDVLVALARAARRAHIRTLSLGSELDSLSGQRRRWRRVARRVRHAYDGELSYGMAWSAVLRRGPREPLRYVDQVGVDAYFPIALDDGARPGRIRRKLVPFANALERLQRRYRGKRLVLAEVGLRSARGAYRKPWRHKGPATASLTAQDRYLRAYCDLAQDIGARGLYWWHVDLDPPRRPRRDSGYELLGKPAEQALGTCLRR